MHGQNFEEEITLEEPGTWPSARLATRLDSRTKYTYETACQGKLYEYKANEPLYHVVAFYDEVLVRTVQLYLEKDEVVDQDHQWTLPCSWAAGQCQANGLAYVWNTTKPDYCPVFLVKEFLGERLHPSSPWTLVQLSVQKPR